MTPFFLNCFSYLFIVYVAGWYTFKRMTDALILALGLIVMLCMENPITGDSNFAYIGVAGWKART